MTTSMSVHQRWMSMPWGVINGIIAAVFAVCGWYAAVYYPDDEPSIRVIIPMFGVYVYFVIALLCNRRSTMVSPHGVTVFVWPFLVRLPRRVKVEKIRHCYLRRVSNFDDQGTLLETYYSVGVETLTGLQIEISEPHDTPEEAAAVAYRIAGVLNRSVPAGRSPIPVYEVEQLPETREILSKLLTAGVWLAVLLGAIFLGFAWEEEDARLRKARRSSVNLLLASPFTPEKKALRAGRIVGIP